MTWTREQFRRHVGVIDVDKITARTPGWNWDWWNYADNILFYGKNDWERAIGIIYKFVEGSQQFQVFGCPFPGNPPAFDECILFEEKGGGQIDEQDEDICTRALAALPRASGRLDSMVLQPSLTTNGEIIEYSPPAEGEIFHEVEAEKPAIAPVVIGVALGATLLGLAFLALRR